MPMFGLPSLTAVAEDPKISIWNAEFLINSKEDKWIVSKWAPWRTTVRSCTISQRLSCGETLPLLSSSDWFCDVITFHDNTLSRSTPFPVQRWVQPNYHYHFPAFDTFLPQDDPHPGQRTHDLDYKRNAYKYKQGDQMFPGLVKGYYSIYKL